jgi:hypothetical protein
MKYKVGDKVRIKSLDWYNKNKNNRNEITFENNPHWRFVANQSEHCGQIATITSVSKTAYRFENIPWNWTDEMIEGLAEEEALKQYEVPTGSINIWDLPNGYQFTDENGNVINAQKIVLEKKKKDVSLTQEQINTMIYDSCVLFCKHCGCGIPRETCTSLGTCEEHDEYRNAIRIHLMEKKKKEYPKLFVDCCAILYPNDNFQIVSQRVKGHKGDLLFHFQKLLICRDAYWKLYGEEMGLGKPWEPDWLDDNAKYSIYTIKGVLTKAISCYDGAILTFPTEEMRDAFYENFKEQINSCKELL